MKQPALATSPSTSPTEARTVRRYILILAIIGIALYAWNIRNVLFWDDADWILNNPIVHALSWANLKFLLTHDTLAGIGLVSNYYRPFLFFTFLLNYLTGGTNPIWYHVVNDGLHIGNAILLFVILRRYFRDIRIPFIASLLFLIHPLQTEAVTYVAGRGDPLSVFLMLGALWLFLRGQRWLSYGAAILAILSRETAFLFPLYLMVFLMAFESMDRWWRSFAMAFKRILPFLGISFVYGLLRLTVLNFQNTLNFYRQANVYTEHLSYRIYTFLHALAVYISLAFVPIHLHMERDIAVNSSLFQWPVWPSMAGILLVLWWLWHLYQTRSRDFGVWLFGVGWFFINLAPTSGIVPINALIYEHWLYLSLAGFFLIISVYAVRLWDRIHAHAKPIAVLVSIAALGYASFLGMQTIKRNIIWGKTEEFYLQILSYEPKNVRVLNNLANYYSDHNDSKKAEEFLWRAVDVADVQPAPYYNLANTLRDRGDMAGALELYKKSIEVDPSFPYSYTNIAAIYAQQGNLSQALTYLQKLQQLQPSNYQVYYNLGIVLRGLDRMAEARQAFMTGRSLAPDPQTRQLFDAALSST